MIVWFDGWLGLSSCLLGEGNIRRRRRRPLLIFVLLEDSMPGLFLDFVYLLKEILLFRLFSFPGGRFHKAKFAHFFMFHESAFHAALEVLDLVVPASFWNELVLDHAIWVFFCLGVAFMEMVEREGTSIGGFGHYNYLWWNRFRIKVQISRRIPGGRLYSIIIFLILTSWTKNQQSPTAKFMTSTTPTSRKSLTQNTSNNSSVFSIPALSSTSASAAATASFAVSASQLEDTLNTTSKISKEASSFLEANFRSGA